MGCLLHTGRFGKTAFTLDELCGEHRALIEPSIREYEAAHPDGACTPTCGCMTTEELLASIRWGKGADMAVADDPVDDTLGLLIWLRNACYGMPGYQKVQAPEGFATFTVSTAETLDAMIERLRRKKEAG